MTTSLDAAKVDGCDKLEGFWRLNKFVEGVESHLRPELDLRSLMAHELTPSSPNPTATNTRSHTSHVEPLR
jgi:hypothetical protein